MLDAKGIADHLREQQRRFADRDMRWDRVRAARNGDLSQIAPQMFSDEIERPIIANFIDVVGRDMAEMLAPLPTFQCDSATMASDTARRSADKRTKIMAAYLRESRLDRQMLSGADHLNTYAATVFYLEPDFEGKIPRVCVEDPIGGYADFDRWGRLRSYTKRFYHDPHTLMNLFPEFVTEIEAASDRALPGTGGKVEIVRYCDKEQISIALNAKEMHMLISVPNPLKETPVVIARRAWLHAEEYHGQFDDSVWIMIVRDVLARLNLEAVTKSVQAPLAVPNDLQEFAMGPDSIMRSNTPEKIRRVGLELPQGGFAESQLLMEEMRLSTRYPEARTGAVDASVVTGKGVQALLGGYNTAIQAGQMALRDAFRDLARMLFKMDETYWPNVVKNISGNADGTPYEVNYKPSKDIAGDHGCCTVEYGFAAGMDPNRAVVMLLQLRAEKAFSRDFFVRQLPLAINITEEQSKVDVEEVRESIKQGIYGYVQAIPALAQQGMDPSEPVRKAAMLVKGIQKGGMIEDVVMEIFAPTPPPGMAPPGAPGEQQQGPGMGQTGGGLTESGLMSGVPQGQAGMAPGGRPDLSVMLSGLTGSGKPTMSAQVLRRRRI